ncbi:integrase core domain protein [mine drainage metagenome]|uniref:Integrase core domain protein n=1 Tax=mine drainage metagenome TaxID=410659 RepID=A0A1J5RCE2_9ZZZZ
MAPRLTQAQKSLAFRLHKQGLSQREIARQICCSSSVLSIMFRDKASSVGVMETWSPRAGRLSIDDREQILLGVRAGESMSAIARRIGRSASTVTREVIANGGAEGYVAWRAQQCARRPKSGKLMRGPLHREVTKHLEQFWSPQEIARRLPLDYPGDSTMRVGHETIYQSLFVHGRGELSRELARCLRSGKTRRKRPLSVDGRGQIPNMVMIAERPAEVDDRPVPGHWEGDLILGAEGKSAVGTLVERTSRFTLLLHLKDGRGADNVVKAMQKMIKTLPGELMKSVTWDQDRELVNHARFTVATGVPVYFCDPHSPWQRGSNENTNGLFRQYMPKGTDLSKLSAADLRRIQRSLNGRPRATLSYMTPLEKFTEIVASTG